MGFLSNKIWVRIFLGHLTLHKSQVHSCDVMWLAVHSKSSKRSVNVRLHCIVSNLKSISKIWMEKFCYSFVTAPREKKFRYSWKNFVTVSFTAPKISLQFRYSPKKNFVTAPRELGAILTKVFQSLLCAILLIRASASSGY